ncbi:MAG: ParB/RepB/Spo0J family partition protein [Streptosporangiaceae bacterium]
MAQGNGQAVLISGGFSSVRPGGDEPDFGQPVTNDRLDLKNFENLPARDVPVMELSPGVYLRQSGTSSTHVQVLIDAAGSSALPPILVQEDGWRVIDGLHRLQAAKLRGDALIRARFLDCTDSEALVLGMKANSAHGLPLSKADRVCGAKRVLTAHPDWSDRVIADISGLSANTIGSLRGRTAGTELPGGKRLGRDGRRRPVTSVEGRRRAAEYIGTHPDAPLRQVAKETDVSLGTVHDVSARLRRGISPEQNGHRVRAGRLAAHPANGSASSVTAAPGADGAAPRRKNHTDETLTWTGVAAKVANDPAIRYTEGGKEFLRWMALHATDPEGWRECVDAIPPHWLGVMVPIADTISKEWNQFAERLRSKQEAVR